MERVIRGSWCKLFKGFKGNRNIVTLDCNGVVGFHRVIQLTILCLSSLGMCLDTTEDMVLVPIASGNLNIWLE